MRRPLMLFAALVLCGCDEPRAAPDPSAAGQGAPEPAASDSAPASAAVDSAIFVGGDSTTSQTLHVAWRKSDQIDFRYVVTDRATGDQKRLEGRATASQAGDSEMDDDEKGVGYAVDEYVFEHGDCWFSARIDHDGAKRAKMIATSGCPYEVSLETSPILGRLAQ
jgi:hypothetical protein